MNRIFDLQQIPGLNQEFYLAWWEIRDRPERQNWRLLPRSQGSSHLLLMNYTGCEYESIFCQLTWADKISAKSSPEIVEDPIPVGLSHSGVNVIAAIAELRDLLGQQLHALGRIAEDNGLINLWKKNKIIITPVA